MRPDNDGPPLLSVVIPSCNGERHLPACLESLAGQTMSRFEVLVVENGSTDDTAAIVARDFPWVRLIRMPGRQGFSRPVNVGWRAASASWVFVLNDDTVCEPDCLEALLESTRGRPEADFFPATMVYYSDPSVVNTAGHRLCRNGTVEEVGIGEPYAAHTEAREVFGACAGAALYRRELLERLSGFDEDFWIIYEDVDFDFRAQLAGAVCWTAPHARVRHRVSQFMGADSPRMLHAYLKNRGLCLVKVFPPALWRSCRRPILMELWTSTAAVVRRGQWSVLFRTFWDQLRLGPRMLRKRRHLVSLLRERQSRIVAWAEVASQSPGRSVPPRPPSPPGRLWRNLVPGLLALVTMAPFFLWSACAAIQDRLCGLPSRLVR